MDKTYFQNAKAQMKEFQEKMKKDGKEFFLSVSKELFEQNPTLLKFGWIQYTPYYNDGDACVFSAHLEYPKMLLDGEDESEYEEERWFSKDEKDTKPAMVCDKVIEFLSQFDDNDMELLFGDHCEVIVTKDGIEVESYDHD